MYDLVLILAAVIGLTYFSYSAGKNKVKREISEESLNATKKAIEARDSIKSVDDAKRLLLEYSD